MTACLWCERDAPDTRTRKNNQEKQFCGDACKNAFWSASRLWIREAIKTRLLTVANLKLAVTVHGAKDSKDKAA